MNLRTQVIVQLQVEGAHCWPDAKFVFKQVDFLSDRHRHIFHIKVYMLVHHDERDIEFILFKREVISYLNSKYMNSDSNMLEFGPMSCEAIARDILTKFNATKVEVWEDNENGAIIETI